MALKTTKPKSTPKGGTAPKSTPPIENFPTAGKK